MSFQNYPVWPFSDHTMFTRGHDLDPKSKVDRIEISIFEIKSRIVDWLQRSFPVATAGIRDDGETTQLEDPPAFPPEVNGVALQLKTP